MFGRMTVGRSVVYGTGVCFDGSPDYKAGGITLDLTTFPALNIDTTFPDQSVIRAGVQFLRYGQVLTKITAPATDTITISGSPTGGTIAITVTNSLGSQTASAIAYNATTATVQAALVALSNVGAGNAVVGGSTGSPYTVTYNNSLGATATTAASSLTGGTSPGVTVVANAPGGNVGYFGPYDPNATDGRQNLNRGECFILDRTYLPAEGADGLLPSNGIIGGVFDGGLCWLARILQSGTNAHSLTAGPTFSDFEAAFPMIRFVEM